MDLNQDYNQLELAPEYEFSTHLGFRRYKRLSIGINSAAEIFQNAVRETLTGLDGAFNFIDDILVFGRTEKEHN